MKTFTSRCLRPFTRFQLKEFLVGLGGVDMFSYCLDCNLSVLFACYLAFLFVVRVLSVNEYVVFV